MVVDNYESVTGNLFYDEWGDAHFVGGAVGSIDLPDLPDIGANILNGVSDSAEVSLLIAGLGAAAYLVVTEGKNFCEYIGSKFKG